MIRTSELSLLLSLTCLNACNHDKLTKKFNHKFTINDSNFSRVAEYAVNSLIITIRPLSQVDAISSRKSKGQGLQEEDNIYKDMVRIMKWKNIN